MKNHNLEPNSEADRLKSKQKRISFLYNWIYYKKITGSNVFISAILSEIAVIAVYQFDIVSFLWLNVIGAAAVIIFSAIGLLFYKLKAVNS